MMAIHTMTIILVLMQAWMSWALRITKVSVPSPIMVGEDGLLECQWAPEGENVYSLKWYLGLHEFYRWTPGFEEPIQIFPADKTFIVDRRESGEGRVKVRNVTLGAAGMLLCEISLEGPIFHTEYKDVNLTVVDPPDTRPIITGGRGVLEIPNEIVVLNCTSPGAKPAASLTFSINEEPAMEKWLKRYPVYEDPFTKLHTSTLGLAFPLLPRFLQRGYVSVKCAANILSVYWESSDILVAGVMPQEPIVMEGFASAAGLTTDRSLILSRKVLLYLHELIVIMLLYFF